MKALIFDGREKADTEGVEIREILREALAQRGWETETKELAEMKIAPCVGCFNCWVKTPGQCSQNDQGQELTKARAHCDALILLCPVTFGGYSSRLKYAMDRNIPNLLPFFIKVNGEMHHPQRYSRHALFSIGWQEKPDAESADLFSRLNHRNALNMQATAEGSVVLTGKQTAGDRKKLVENLLDRLEALS